MQAIQSKLTGVVPEIDNRGLAMCALISQYLVLPVIYGRIAIGTDPKIRFPYMTVESAPGEDIEMYTMGKYQLTFSYLIDWFCIDNSPSDLTMLVNNIGENLSKLFSNNALNDLATVGATHNFDSYEPYWTEVQKFGFRSTQSFRNPLSVQKESWMRLGRATISVRSWVLK